MLFKIVQISLVWWSSTLPLEAFAPEVPPIQKRYEVRGFAAKDSQFTYRLPNDTRPEAYDLSLRTAIDEGDFAFDGSMQIDILIVNATREVTIHSKILNIKSIRLTSVSEARAVDLLPWKTDIVTDFLIIPTKSAELLPGERYRLEIKYAGELREGPRGFYRTKSDGLRWIAATQFEPQGARLAFPCYDEPGLKAIFTIRIVHSASYSAISNMPGTSSKNADGMMTTQFDTTPLISSYLIAFAVTDFRYRQNAANSTLPMRVYATPTAYGLTRFPLVEGEKAIKVLAEYLRLPYALPKMDQIFLRGMWGAMENWGLITYGSGLLINETTASLPSRINVFATIAHEMSHQWFGNIVSPKWWSALWLSEGFATFFQNIVIDLIYPDYHIFDQFSTQYVHNMFHRDAIALSRPMTFYVEHPSSIHGLFDSIAYDKSACVIRTFFTALTKETFLKGLSNYLRINAFTAVDEDALFEALDHAAKQDGVLDSKLNMKDIFASWSRQAGFPLLTVERNYENGSITISQERYMNNMSSPLINGSTWWIPYNFATANSPIFDDTRAEGWLPQHQRSKLIEPTGNRSWAPSDWVLFNKQQTSYYRVMYDIRNWKLLIAELNSGPNNKIHPISRAQLLNDQRSFVQSGRLPASMLIETLAYLKHETDYAPWVAGSEALLYLNKVLASTDHYEPFHNKAVSVIQSAMAQSVDFAQGDISNLTVETQGIITQLACHFKIEGCRNDHTVPNSEENSEAAQKHYY